MDSTSGKWYEILLCDVLSNNKWKRILSCIWFWASLCFILECTFETVAGMISKFQLIWDCIKPNENKNNWGWKFRNKTAWLVTPVYVWFIYTWYHVNDFIVAASMINRNIPYLWNQLRHISANMYSTRSWPQAISYGKSAIMSMNCVPDYSVNIKWS